jgi:uncharacterized membrane protein
MQSKKNVLAQLSLLLLSLIGAGIAIYLTSVHYAQVPLLCSTHGVIDCQRVTTSSYSLVPGTSIPITVPGLGWTLVSALLAAATFRAGMNRYRILVAQVIWSFVALLGVLYLVYAEIVLLHTICAWCTVFHVIILLIFLISLVQLLTPAEEPDAQYDEEVSVASPPTPTRSN